MSEITEGQDVQAPPAPDAPAPQTEGDAPARTQGRSIPGDIAVQTDVERGVVGVLRTVYDPEIPVDIYELGLIYDVRVGGDGQVDIDMTLTSPMCPVAGTLPGEVQSRVESVPGVAGAHVNVVWEPPWDMTKMSEAAKLKLNVG
jgi:FeS assembly SUF system protein